MNAPRVLLATDAAFSRNADTWIWAAMLPPAFEVEGAPPPSCPPEAADVLRLGALALLHRLDSQTAWLSLEATKELECRM